MANQANILCFDEIFNMQISFLSLLDSDNGQNEKERIYWLTSFLTIPMNYNYGVSLKCLCFICLNASFIHTTYLKRML